MNVKKIEKLWKKILSEIGENPDRAGLIDTPKRIAKMYTEIFRGYDEKQKPNVTVFDNGTDGITYSQMIVDTGGFYSQCEHHGISFYGKYYFAYLPSLKGKILGLSKVARIIDYHSAKLQIQERLVQDVVNDLWKALCKDNVEPPLGMALVMEGEHLCKTMRGAKKKGKMVTSDLRGVFLEKPEVRAEFNAWCNIVK